MLSQPACFSILAINDCLTDELQVFRDQTNVFEEYLYTIFHFLPNSEEQLKSILWQQMLDAYSDCDFLRQVYPNYSAQLIQFLSTYTNNINEYVYIFRFLYPQYVEKLYKKREDGVLEDLAKDGATVALFDKDFKLAMRQIQSSLYMHMNSKEDVDREVQQQKDADLTDRIQKAQQPDQAFGGSSIGQPETYEYDQITYLEDHKKNRNFSFMQSLILIAAYIAGSNKESTDVRLFEMEKSRQRRGGNQNNTNATKDGGQFLLGKTKRFSLDRLLAIAQHLASLEIEGATECQMINHSLDFYACINTLVHEDLLKK